MEPANEVPAAAELAQALLRSFVNSRNVRPGQLFVEAPAELLASPGIWRLLASLPGTMPGTAGRGAPPFSVRQR